MTLAASASTPTWAQDNSATLPDEPDYVIATDPRLTPPVPVISLTRPYNAYEDTIGPDFTALNLPPVELYSDVIRYQYDLPQPDSHLYQTVVQFALVGDGSRAQLILIHADRYSIGQPTLLRRERAWITLADYDALQREVARLASDLSDNDLAHRRSFTVCSHTQTSRLDLRITAEAAIILRREGNCYPDGAAYRAGDAVVRAAERALGHPVELRPVRPTLGGRADCRRDR